MKKREAFIKKHDAGIYIHLPFCKQKCLYCDFYSFSDLSELKKYVQLLIKEAELYSSLLDEYSFSTLYLGGGTPSLMDEGSLSRLFDFFQAQAYWDDLKEITIEVNPESIHLEKLKFYRSLGINRVSLGVQSFQPEIQKKLGRLASSDEVERAVCAIQDTFDNYSIDLIYGIPEQNLAKEMARVLTLSPPHLSAYCLTLAEGTPLYMKRGDFTLVDDELNSQFLELHESLEKAGYCHYEISNYGREGRESRHNLHYWRRHPYLGLGAGASGFIGKKRYSNLGLKEYSEKLEMGLLPKGEEEALTDEDVLLENYMLGLRTVEGALFQYKNKKMKSCIENFIHEGLLRKKEERVLPTVKGWLVLDALIRQIYQCF